MPHGTCPWHSHMAKEPSPCHIKPCNSYLFSGKAGKFTKAGKYNKYLAGTKGVTFTALNGVNNKGNINGFKGSFVIKDAKTGELEFKAGNTITRNGASKTINQIDPTNKDDKDELKGWVQYTYQGLDGVVTSDWVLVTLKTTGNAPIK